MADALESVLADNTKRVYQTQWKFFDKRCSQMGRCAPCQPIP